MSKLIVDNAGIFTLDITGSLIIGEIGNQTEYTYGIVTCTQGTSSIIEWPTASYNSAFFNYSVLSGSNMRAGQLISVWNDSTASFTETTTMDLGDTTDVGVLVDVGSGNVKFLATIADGQWLVKSSVNLI